MEKTQPQEINLTRKKTVYDKANSILDMRGIEQKKGLILTKLRRYFDDDKNYLESRILNQGDVVLLSGGGHGFCMLENSEIIEVKQGPYAGDRDKTRFDPIKDDQVRLK